MKHKGSGGGDQTPLPTMANIVPSCCGSSFWRNSTGEQIAFSEVQRDQWKNFSKTFQLEKFTFHPTFSFKL